MNKGASLFAITVALVACGASSALAQQAGEAASTPGAETQPTGTSFSMGTVMEGDIIVTGSRIARRDYTSNSPLTSFGSETLANVTQPTLADTMRQLPQIAPVGGNSLNLRGLGTARTLTLIDGRRPVSSNLTLLPQALIENVELITGGASAAYGSDAIAGVANFILKKNFSGLQINASQSIRTAGDAPDWQASVTLGGNFDDGRGNAVLSLEYFHQGLVMMDERDWTAGTFRQGNLPEGEVNFGTNRPTQAAFDQVFGAYGVGAGLVRPGTNISFNPDGTLYSTGLGVYNVRPWNQPSFIEGSYINVGNARLYDTRPMRSLTGSAELTRKNLFARVSYELTDDLQTFVQVQAGRNNSLTFGNPTPLKGTDILIQIPVTNPYIPADLRTLLQSRENPDAPMTYFYSADNVGNRPYHVQTDFYQVTVGLAGKLPFKDWTWDAYASTGGVDTNFVGERHYSMSALQTLLSAPDGGASLCPGGYNPFGYQALNDQCRNFLERTVRETTTTRQQVIEATMQGGLFNLPAGEVRVAIGADYRRNSSKYRPDSQTFAGRSDIAFYSTFPTQGVDTVKEVFGEVALPIIHNTFLIKKMELNLGYRYSDYRYIGSVHAYKADANWEVNDVLRLRGGYERAVRAPSVEQLTDPQARAFDDSFGQPPLNGDPCDVRTQYRTGPNAAAVRNLCLAQGVPNVSIDQFQSPSITYPITTGGNPNLNEETADTFSIGAVVTSPFASGPFRSLSFSIDYFNISLDGAIGTVTAPQVAQLCFNATGGSNPNYSADNVYCRQITRGPTGEIFNVDVLQLNLGGYKTSGIDAQVDWRVPVGPGNLTVKGVVSRLLTYELQNRPGDPFLEYAGTIGNNQVQGGGNSKPHWRGLLTLNYQIGPVNLGSAWRYTGAQKASSCVGIADCTVEGVKAFSYFDLNMSVRPADNFTIFATVNNLFDKDPPQYPIGSGNVNTAVYDSIGRRVSVGARVNF